MLPSPARLVATVAPRGLPLARRLVRAGLGRVLGPPAFDPDAHPGDPGLYGPGSASWRVIAEPAAIVGGLRALLVQMLHPGAMAGVADHSRFRDDPLGRLHRTSAYVGTTTFGAVPEVLGAVRTVRRVHRSVAGLAPDGRPYRADDPELLCWVSVALTSSFLAADRAYAARPADAATRDAFVAEQSRAAALLDPRVDLDRLASDPSAVAALRAGTLPLPLLEAGMLPRSVDDLEARLAAFRADLAVHQQGREAFRFLLHPPLAPQVRAAYLPLLAGALATLEPAERRLLRLPAAAWLYWPVQAQTRGLLAGLRLASGTSPSAAAATARARCVPEPG